MFNHVQDKNNKNNNKYNNCGMTKQSGRYVINSWEGTTYNWCCFSIWCLSLINDMEKKILEKKCYHCVLCKDSVVVKDHLFRLGALCDCQTQIFVCGVAQITNGEDS